MNNSHSLSSDVKYYNPVGRCPGHPITRAIDSSGFCVPWSYNHQVICVWCHDPLVQLDHNGRPMNLTPPVQRTPHPAYATSSAPGGYAYTSADHGSDYVSGSGSASGSGSGGGSGSGSGPATGDSGAAPASPTLPPLFSHYKFPM